MHKTTCRLLTLVLSFTVVGIVAEGETAAAVKPASPYDFNGDGRRDLVTVVDDKASVIFRRKKGLDLKKPQKYSLHAGMTGPETMASADFDRDGYADLAVGDDGAVGTFNQITVVVVFGGKNGLSKRRFRYRPPVKGLAIDLSVADFERDGYPDLLVGSSYHAYVMRGGPKIATKRPALVSVPNVNTVPQGSSPGGANYLISTTAGDFTGDGHPDVVSIAQGARIGLSRGSVEGPRSMVWWDAPVPIDPGGKISSGDLDGDGYTDLVIAMDINEKAPDGGHFTVLYGSQTGLRARPGKTRITQSTPGVPGTGRSGEGFGSGPLAVQDVNGDGYADVAVGVRYKKLGEYRQAGAVWMLYGSRKGLTGKNSQMFTVNTPGVPGKLGNRQFGRELALLDVRGDSRPDLIVETGHGEARFNAVTILSGTKKGVTTKKALFVTSEKTTAKVGSFALFGILPR
ncbi:FG-GAP and VCBS repeat-containing protein [Actinocorallia sp. B10E7]|uniref:VCBS repeat-containing protein n=1 Tax=Actinocorallia sp. B10E7 TaxID=3153558 RepID=UPI00325DAA23